MLRVERIGKISDGLRFVQEHFAAERNGAVAVGSIVHKTESKDLRKHIILAREPLFPLSKIAAKLFRRFFSFYSLMTELQSVRIDKWLWAARFFKTRTLAQEAVELGRVRLDGNRIKSSREVKPGDRLEITRGEEKFTVFVEKLSVVRGPSVCGTNALSRNGRVKNFARRKRRDSKACRRTGTFHQKGAPHQTRRPTHSLFHARRF